MTEQPLDADPFIPTGVDATPEQVAVMLADDVLPVEALTKMPERQYPTSSQIAKAAEASEKPTREVMDRLAPLTEQATGKITKAQLATRLATLSVAVERVVTKSEQLSAERVVVK